MPENRGGRYADADARHRRMEQMALGEQLASQIVHDLRNPLAVVTTGLYLATLEKDLPASVSNAVGGCLAEARDMAERLRRVMLPFRPEPLTPRLLSVKELVAASITQHGGTIELAAEAADCQVWADGLALTKAISSLVQDAVEAARPSGKVTITIRELASAEVERRLAGPAVEVVSLLVSNSGRGFSAEEAAGAFELLRMPGRRGGGLPLACAMIVVENHGGRIAIEGRAEGGAYEVLLPAGKRPPCWAWPDKRCDARCTECELDQAPEGVCCWALRACADTDGVVDWPRRCWDCSYFNTFVLAGRQRGGAE